MRSGPIAAAFVLLLLVMLPAASGTSPYTRQEGVDYYTALGEMGSAHLSYGPAEDGEGLIEYDSCVRAKLRPEYDRGRIRMVSMIHGAYVEFDMNRMEGKKDPVSLSQTIQPPVGPEVSTMVHAIGKARLYVNGDEYMDPSSEDVNYSAEFWITKTGYRDDDTDALRGEAPRFETKKGDVEAHMRLKSLPGSPAPDREDRVTRPAVTPRFAPNEAYFERFGFYNFRYGGTGTLDFTMRADAPDGMNEVVVTIRRPDGSIAGNDTVTASLLDDGTLTKEVPLDQFGFYRVEVFGKVALSSYQFRFTQSAGGPMDFHAWWEEVSFGNDVSPGYNECIKELAIPNQTVFADLTRPPPPPFPLVAVLIAVAGTVAGLGIGLKLIGQAIATESFRKAFSK